MAFDSPIGYTAHYNFPKYALGANPGADALNQNLIEAIDTKIYEFSGTFSLPLKKVSNLISLDYEDNLKLSVANKLDTAQPIKTTSTPQFARLGVGGAADAVIPLKVTGNAKITGALTVDGDIYIGGAINQVNVVDLDVADHAIRLNKGGDDTTALDGGIEMLGTGNALIGSIKYNGTAWLSDLNFDIASGKTYKINNVDVLSATALGSSVVTSSLTSIGTLSHDLNIANTKVYRINSVEVLSATTLGTAVVYSSLTKVGTLTQGVWNATAITDTYIASAVAWNNKISLTALSGVAPITYNNTTGQIGLDQTANYSWTGTHTMLGTLKSYGAGSGSNGYVLNSSGIFGYSATLGTVFILPTDGSAPTFSSGIINKVTFNLYDVSVIRTSTTVGNGAANSYGILMNDTGIYGVGPNQLTANANFKLLTSTGEIQSKLGTIGGWTINATSLYNTNALMSSSGYVSFGATPPTAYGNYVGAWLGYSGGAKLSLYSDANNFMQWNGSSLSVGGGTFTAGTIQTSLSNPKIVLDNSNTLKFYNSLGGYASIYGYRDGTYNAIYTDEDIYARSIKANDNWGFSGSTLNLSHTGIAGFPYYSALSTLSWLTTSGNVTGESITVGSSASGATVKGISVTANVNSGYPTAAIIYGGYFAAIGYTSGGGWAYGIYSTASGAGSNWAGYFDQGSVGIGAEKFIVNDLGRLIKVNNLSATNKYALIGDGTSFTPRALTVSDLTALTASRIAVTDASGFLATSSIASSELFSSCYGSMRNTNSTTAIISDQGWEKYTGFVSYSTNNTSVLNSALTVNNAGMYRVSYSFDFTMSSTTNNWCAFDVFLNGINVPNERAKKSFNATGTGLRSFCHTFLLSLSASDVLDLRFYSADVDTATIIYADFSIDKVSN